MIYKTKKPTSNVNYTIFKHMMELDSACQDNTYLMWWKTRHYKEFKAAQIHFLKHKYDMDANAAELYLKLK